MSEAGPERPSVSALASLVKLISGSDLLAQLAAFSLSRLPRLMRPPQGMYEVKRYEAVVELRDSKGHDARFTKRQWVRFKQDNIIAYQDQAWGEGDFLEDYQCAPGWPVDIYREGHKYRILISLRESKQRGDEERFEIKRRIRNGFLRISEYLQIEVDHPTRQLILTVIFPPSRPPKRVRLVEQKARRSKNVDRELWRELSDGRVEVSWQSRRPRLDETYILDWTW